MYSKTTQTKKAPKVKTKTVLSLPQLKQKVQRAMNAYIRKRDENKPCISCQKRAVTEAGHFIAQGSSGLLRYHLDNLNGQCAQCNRWLHGNLLEYRINLVKKIGLKKVEWLESHRHDTYKWTREELETLLKVIKEL